MQNSYLYHQPTAVQTTGRKQLQLLQQQQPPQQQSAATTATILIRSFEARLCVETNQTPMFLLSILTLRCLRLGSVYLSHLVILSRGSTPQMPQQTSQLYLYSTWP